MSTFELGNFYTRNFIAKITGGGAIEYLPYKDGKVVCATLKLDMNPDAPNIISVTNNKNTIYWAKVFASQKEYVPIFVKSEKNKWRYLGDYRVISIVNDINKIKQYENKINTPISILLELEPKEEYNIQELQISSKK